MPEPFRVNVVSDRDVAVLAVEGEFDLSCAEEFRTARAEALGLKRPVVIDLTECDFIDSTGIACVIGTFHEVEQTGRRFALVGSGIQVRRVLELVGIPRMVPCFSSTAEAIAELTRAG